MLRFVMETIGLAINIGIRASGGASYKGGSAASGAAGTLDVGATITASIGALVKFGVQIHAIIQSINKVCLSSANKATEGAEQLNYSEAPSNAYASLDETLQISNSALDNEKLPQRENIYGAPEFSRGSIVNPNNNGKLEDYEVDSRYILEVYKRDVSDPTYGYFKSGNEWHKIYFDPNYKSSSYQGAYFHVRPYQERSGTASQFPITLNYNQFSRIDPATLTILLVHVNALFAALPNPAPPGQDLNSRPTLTIYSGAYQDLTASGRAQALQDCEQIRAYLALYFPAADFNILMAERSTYGSVWGTFTVPTGAVGFEFTVKINKFGF